MVLQAVVWSHAASFQTAAHKGSRALLNASAGRYFLVNYPLSGLFDELRPPRCDTRNPGQCWAEITQWQPKGGTKVGFTQ